MKLLLVSLLVIVWFIPSPSARNRDEQTPTKNAAETSKTEEAKPTQPAVEPETMVNREPSKQEKKTQTTNATQPPHNWPERLNAISIVVIAIFAVVTAIAIICQVRTARSTDRAWMIGSPNMRKLDSPLEPEPNCCTLAVSKIPVEPQLGYCRPALLSERLNLSVIFRRRRVT